VRWFAQALFWILLGVVKRYAAGFLIFFLGLMVVCLGMFRNLSGMLRALFKVV